MSQTCCTATLKTIYYALLHIQYNYLYGATTTILIKHCYSGKCCLYSKLRDMVGDHIEQLRIFTVYSLYVIEIQLRYVKSLQLSRTKTTTRLYNTRNQIKTEPHRLGFFNKRKLVALAKLLLSITR